MAIVYSGDTGFLPTSLYVIGVNGNFITTLPNTATTTQYFNAGGISFAAGASLNPFKSSDLFTNYKKEKVFSASNLSKFSAAFGQKATKTPFSVISTSVTGDSKSIAPIDDPRATHRVTLGSANNNFASLFYSSISHMDEVVFTDKEAGTTVQSFFMGFEGGVTIGSTRNILIGYVGTTGSGGVTSFASITQDFGTTFEIKNTKSGTTSSVAGLTPLIKDKDFRVRVTSLMASITGGYKGTTFGVTFADGTQRHAIFPQDPGRPNSARSNLEQLLRVKQVFDLNSSCFTQATGYLKTIFVNNIDDETNSAGVLGITLDGISGGTNGTSEIDHLIASLDVKLRDQQAQTQRGYNILRNVHTIRRLVNTNF